MPKRCPDWLEEDWYRFNPWSVHETNG
jgi:hypothetical protein